MDEEEWIAYKGFSEPDINLEGNKLVVSWQPKSLEELDAFCHFHYGKPFIELNMGYEEVVESVLKDMMRTIETEIEALPMRVLALESKDQ